MHKLDFRLRIVGKVTSATAKAVEAHARALEMTCLDAGLEVSADLCAVSDGVEDAGDPEPVAESPTPPAPATDPIPASAPKGVVANAIARARGKR